MHAFHHLVHFVQKNLDNFIKFVRADFFPKLPDPWPVNHTGSPASDWWRDLAVSAVNFRLNAVNISEMSKFNRMLNSKAQKTLYLESFDTQGVTECQVQVHKKSGLI